MPFNKSCEAFDASGELIAYLGCGVCGFAWAPSLWAKDKAWFAENIYNADYIKFDPDYSGERAANQAKNIIFNYSFARKSIRHLDYGSGGGQLTEKLINSGFNSTSYDPFIHSEAPHGKFNLITCFEVLEHVPDPLALMCDLATYLDDEGVLTTSTLLLDKTTDLNKWWYAAPRNGHISLYSVEALENLAAQNGLCGNITNSGTHAFYKKLPSWA